MRNIVIINEAHSLMEDQKRALAEKFPNADVEKIAIPASGLNLQEMKELVKDLIQDDANIVFVSPIPAMMVLLAREIAKIEYYKGEADARCLPSGCPNVEMHVFHNDRREKKELPDGRIIQVVSQTGWQLV